MILDIAICVAVMFGIGQPSSPDSLVAPMRIDTLTDLELTIFPPERTILPITYQISWGDGTSLWTKALHSNTDYTRYHRYHRFGDFSIRVRAQDSLEHLSAWGKPITVTVTHPVLKWVFRTSDPIVASPSIDKNGNIYIGDESGKLYCVNPQGQFRWSFQTQGPVYASAVIHKGLVYVASMDSNLYCLDTKGKMRWKLYLEDEFYTPPAIDAKGNIYIGSNAGKLLAITPKGKLRWAYKTGDEISSSPSIGLNGLIYTTSDSVYCIDSRGRRHWAFGTDECDYFFAAAIPDPEGNVYTGNDDGFLYCIRPDGRLRWRAPVPDEDEIKTEVTIGPNDTLFLGTEGYYLCRKPPNGLIRTIYEADDVLIAPPALSTNGTAYFFPDDGLVYALSSQGRLVWKYEIAVEEKDLCYTSAPTIGPDSTVYVGSWDGGLYAFEGDGPPANSLWPQYRHDAQHTGRLTRPEK